MRWRIALLVSAAIAISYLDRQTLPVAVKAISYDIPLSNEQFSFLQSAFLLAYAFMYAGGGKLSDILGTRRGFFVIMLFWSLACASHSLALTFGMLAGSRFLLGLGEGGGFPAATRAVAEWFPVKERATAMGIINAGTAVGAVVAPPLIASILLLANWRWIFVVAGLMGLIWAICWRVYYRLPQLEETGATSGSERHVPGNCSQRRTGSKCRRDAAHSSRPARARLLGARIIQHCLFRATVMVDAGHGAADRPIPARGGWKRGRIGRLRRRNGWNCFRRVGRIPA